MEEFTRTFDDLMSSKQGSKEASSTSKDDAKGQAVGDINQPLVSTATRGGYVLQEKKKTAPWKQSGKEQQTSRPLAREKEQTSQGHARGRIGQPGLFLRRDSSSSQRSSLDSPDFDSSPVTPVQVRITFGDKWMLLLLLKLVVTLNDALGKYM